MKTMHALSLTAAILGLAGTASAIDPYISELFWNPASTDQGWERVELAGDPGASLDGYWFVVMEGENVPSGTIDQLIDLSGLTFGTNGLLLISDDSTGVNVLQPPPEPGTNVAVIDFTPDIENGANTFILVKGAPTFALGQDLDQGPGGPTEIGDGVLDPGTFGGVTVLDAVGWIDAASSAVDYDYANDPQIAVPGGALGQLLDTSGAPYDANCFFRVRTSDCAGPANWAGGFLPGATPPGPFSWDGTRIFGFTEAGLDPLSVIPSLGSLNACAIGSTSCYPDCDLSGTLNIDDFICFQTFFAIGDPYADCDLSGNLNIDDFICFQTFYAIGC